jgi:1-acyl-sn-glycerol-3-phosphate acyltransferase
MAMLSGMPILPVTIDGTRHTLPAGRLTVRRGNTARVTISPPVDPADYGREGIGRLMAVVRDVIERHLSVDWNRAGLDMKWVKEENDQGNRDLALRIHSGSQPR